MAPHSRRRASNTRCSHLRPAPAGLCYEKLLVAPFPPTSDVETARIARLNAPTTLSPPRLAGGRPMSTLGDVRTTLETALSFGPRSREVAIYRVLAMLPKDGEIVTAEELAWAMPPNSVTGSSTRPSV